MRALLNVCTTRTPFRHINGDIYIQKDGVSMGSPLGPLFANAYMCHIENNILPTLQAQPLAYARYVDDIFIITKDRLNIEDLRSSFNGLHDNIKFTAEIEQHNRMAFLDVMLDPECS